jgi:hypothetical protein
MNEQTQVEIRLSEQWQRILLIMLLSLLLAACGSEEEPAAPSMRTTVVTEAVPPTPDQAPRSAIEALLQSNSIDLPASLVDRIVKNYQDGLADEEYALSLLSVQLTDVCPPGLLKFLRQDYSDASVRLREELKPTKATIALDVSLLNASPPGWALPAGEAEHVSGDPGRVYFPFSFPLAAVADFTSIPEQYLFSFQGATYIKVKINSALLAVLLQNQPLEDFLREHPDQQIRFGAGDDIPLWDPAVSSARFIQAEIALSDMNKAERSGEPLAPMVDGYSKPENIPTQLLFPDPPTVSDQQNFEVLLKEHKTMIDLGGKRPTVAELLAAADALIKRGILPQELDPDFGYTYTARNRSCVPALFVYYDEETTPEGLRFSAHSFTFNCQE